MSAKRKFPTKLTLKQFLDRYCTEAQSAAVMNSILEEIDNAKNEATKEACRNIMIFFALALNSIYGFGKKRNGKVFEYVESLANGVNTGEFTLGDVVKQVREEDVIGFMPEDDNAD